MKKTILVLLLSFVLMLTSCGIKEEQVLDNAEIVNENVITSEAETSNKFKTEDESLEDILTKYYWENFIQDYEVFKFNPDGTVHIIGTNPEYYYNKNNLESALQNSEPNSFGKYKIEGDKLLVDLFDSGSYIELSYVDKNENINWDLGIEKFLPTDEKFFYQVNYVPHEYIDDNALYFVNMNIEIK